MSILNFSFTVVGASVNDRANFLKGGGTKDFTYCH